MTDAKLIYRLRREFETESLTRDDVPAHWQKMRGQVGLTLPLSWCEEALIKCDGDVEAAKVWLVEECRKVGYFGRA